MRPGEDWKHVRGLLERGKSIIVVSQMRTASLFIDGPHIEHQFGLGDEVIVRPAKHSLQAFVNPTVNEMFQKEGIKPGIACQ